MIEFTFTREQWYKMDVDGMIEWIRAFCNEQTDFEMEDVEETYFDNHICDYATRWTSVKFRFADPKVAMAFKLAWGGNC